MISTENINKNQYYNILKTKANNYPYPNGRSYTDFQLGGNFLI